MNKKDKILAEIMYQIAQAMPAPRMDCPSVNLDRVEVYLAKKLPQILTANEQEDEKVHNIHCPECGEFIGVGLLMYNPNASKPYDPHEVAQMKDKDEKGNLA